MITIQSKFAQYPQSMCEYQASKDGRWGWLLCTAHAEDSIALEEIQAEIKLEILNSQVLEISRMEIEKWLKDFFADFHWKMHARLRKTDLHERGISLFFAVIYDAEIYFVQFGRIFCASTKGSKLQAVGKTWKNYHVQSMEDLGLFGMSEEDIRVRVQHLSLPENENLIILPGTIAGRVFESGTDVNGLLPLIESFSAVKSALGIVLRNVPAPRKTGRKRLTKWQISALFLFLATLLAVLYMLFGNRFLDDFLHKGRKVIQEKIETGTQDISVRMTQPSSIKLRTNWSSPLDFVPNCRPVFNLDHIYLAGGSSLYVFSTKTRKDPEVIEFEDRINFLRASSMGLIIGLANNQIKALDKQNKELWTNSTGNDACEEPGLLIEEITNNEDKRLDRGISVVPQDRSVQILDSVLGTEINKLDLPGELTQLSAYDDFHQCFYAVVGNSLTCLGLLIEN